MTCGSLIQSGRKKDVPEGFRLWKQINEAQFTGGVCVCVCVCVCDCLCL